jgi:large subunit ribosomal protein L18
MENKREQRRIKRHRRIRINVIGTKEKPRLVVHRSLKNLFGQVIDDTVNKTLFSLSTMDKEIKQKFPYGGNVKAAEFFGAVFARRASDKGIKKIIFDRAGYLYHGRVKVFAESLRKGGLEF